MGNVGIATVVATLMVSLMDAKDNQRGLWNLTFLSCGLLALWLISQSRLVERRLNQLISWALRNFSRLEVRDYVALLNLQQGFAVTELRVGHHDWLANKTLTELHLPKKGVLILGIQRTNPSVYIGAPRAKTEVQADDTLVLYGPIERLEELDQRRAGKQGDAAHRAAVTELGELLVEQNEMTEPETPTAK